MSDPSSKQWGLTPPISTALPTAGDTAQNAAMVEELKRQNNYEAPAETQKRQQTLQLLQSVTVEFVKEVSRRKQYPESHLGQFGGRIYPYGSYRLGVFGPGTFIPFRELLVTRLTCCAGSDIDTLVVAPKHVHRDDFFEVYPTVLRTLARDAVGSLTAVPDSFVPIIKLELNQIDIDLIFVSIVTKPSIPISLELKDNKLLDGLDQAGIRAITGPVSFDARSRQEVLIPFIACHRRNSRPCSSTEELPHRPPGHQIMGATTCHLREYSRLPWRCCLGHAGRTSVSVVSSGDRRHHRWQIFFHY